MRLVEKQCLNCHQTLSESDKFCPNCGQETADHSKNLGVLLRHFLADYFTFDNKLFRSLIPLVINPGFLTKEYLEGKRVSYIPPLRLYLFISIAFFLLLSLQGNTGEDEMDRFFGTHLPRLFFLLLPLFGLILRLLYIKSTNFVVHFLFSLHFHAFMFLTGAFLLGVNALLAKFEAILANQILAGIFGLGWLTYLVIAMHRVYQDNGLSLVLRFLALLALYLIVLTIGSVVVLLLTTSISEI